MINTIKINLIKTFTRNKEQGNPAGVVLGNPALTSQEMVEISAQLGFNVGFVKHLRNNLYKARFFSPKQESSICIHVVVAIGYLLASQKKSS